jgi:hypothetical protein
LSRLRRDKAQKRLREMLALAEDESFVVMVWAVDALQSGRAAVAARYLTYPKKASEAKFGGEFFIFKWMLETLLNELFVTKKKARDHRRRNRKLDCTKFETVAVCINTLRKIEDAEDGIRLKDFDVLNLIHRIGHRQFEWQRGFFNLVQIYRAMVLFGGDLAQEHFRISNSISISDFFNCGFAFYAVCQNFPGLKTGVDLSKLNISTHIRDASLAMLAAPLSDARAAAADIRGGLGPVAYKQSVLRKTPLILFEDTALAPLTALIFKRITSGLYYDLVGGGPPIWREIGARFENYCFDLSTAMLSSIEVTGSFKYQFNKSFGSPDLSLREDGMAKVIIECKAKKMSFAAKFSTDPMTDAKQGFSEIIKGVVQLWRFFSHCRRNEEIAKMHANVVGVVLTLDPWLEMSNHRERVLEEARKLASQIDSEILEQDRKHVLFCSIDDYENTLECATEQSLIESIKETEKPEFAGWSLFNVHQKITDNKEVRNPYPFESRIGEINPGWNIGNLLDTEDQTAPDTAIAH